MKLPNNKGFSLVEVLVSIVVLAILFVTAMNAFISVARVNTKANVQQKAATLAQNVLESLETRSLEDTISQFHGTSFELVSSNLNEGTDGYYNIPVSSYGEYMISGTRYIPATTPYLNTPNRKELYLAIKNISDGDSTFDVMIKLNTATYSDSKYVDTMNNFDMPNLLKLDENKLAIIDLKNDYDATAFSNFASQYISYLDGLVIPSAPPSNLNENIKSSTNKVIKIGIEKNASLTNLKVSCSVDYDTRIGSGSYAKTYTDHTDIFNGFKPLIESSIVDGNIFLFYTPSMFTDKDNIIINNNGAKVDFYLVNQKSDLASNIRLTTSDINSGVTTIYTNYPGTLINGVAAMNRNLYTQRISDQRIYDVSVSVYPKGTLDSHVLDRAYVTFQSAKEN